ncbi:SDR family NAD(P)-dependent oxidoreductase [Ilumatobacter sp.]|uniref:SDR family NAD(P)-dependent oxidoreductase n=1 Tax=Ilumatobacter sp. TaxID=1967498 RepID=UPI003B523F9B
MSEPTEPSCDLSGRTAVITGASSGIGRRIALACAQHGASVVVSDVEESPRDGGQPTADEIADRFGTEAAFVRWDVTDLDGAEAVMDAADGFGGVDVCVNNAGLFRGTPFLETTVEDYDQLMDVNVKGVFFAAQAAARRMVGRGGSIINMSSVAGMQGAAGFSVYNTTKGAVRLLTKGLAAELGPIGIRVNAIHPGVVETSMTVDDVPLARGDAAEMYSGMVPLGRLGHPTDIAGVAVFLASDLARYVNGASIVVDGGYLRT